MNLKGELQTMSIIDLRAVCRDLGISCPKTKSGIIKRLLFPLKKEYKMDGFPDPVKKKIGGFIGTPFFGNGDINEGFMEEVIKGNKKSVDMYGNFGANPNEKFINNPFSSSRKTYPIVESAKRGNVKMVKHLLEYYPIDLYKRKRNFAISPFVFRREYIGDYITKLLDHKKKNSRHRGPYQHSKMSGRWNEIISIIKSKKSAKERDDRHQNIKKKRHKKLMEQYE